MILITTIALLAFSALAVGAPRITPWCQVETPGIYDGWIDPPKLTAGVEIEADLSKHWFIDVAATFTDDDILDPESLRGVAFESEVGFDLTATVNESGSLTYGCAFGLLWDAELDPTYPDGMGVETFDPEVRASGYVGPLELWIGVRMPWDGAQWLDFIPTAGIRIEFDIPL